MRAREQKRGDEEGGEKEAMYEAMAFANDFSQVEALFMISIPQGVEHTGVIYYVRLTTPTLPRALQGVSISISSGNRE